MLHLFGALCFVGLVACSVAVVVVLARTDSTPLEGEGQRFPALFL